MSSTEKGRVWERAVAKYLKTFWDFPAFRLRGTEGPRDQGDIGGFDRWALDCKNQAKWNLGSWVTQAKQEAINASKPLSAVIVKREGHSIEDALVVMDLKSWCYLEAYLDGMSTEIRRSL